MGIKEKLQSRKFWAMIVGVVMGIAVVFGLDEGTISTVSGTVATIASLLVYIITEGRVDAAAADRIVYIKVDEAQEEIG